MPLKAARFICSEAMKQFSEKIVEKGRGDYAHLEDG
jgi:hypothetical protein